MPFETAMDDLVQAPPLTSPPPITTARTPTAPRAAFLPALALSRPPRSMGTHISP
jgi:hypothetical protein